MEASEPVAIFNVFKSYTLFFYHFLYISIGLIVLKQQCLAFANVKHHGARYNQIDGKEGY